MFLNYFKNKKNKDIKNAQILYNEIININKLIISEKCNDNLVYLKIAIEINILIIFCIFYGSKLNIENKNRELCQEIMNLFVNDLDYSFRSAGIGDMSIGKYVKKTLKKFYFRVNKLEIIFKNNDFKGFYNYCKNVDLFNNNQKKDQTIKFIFNNCIKLINRTSKGKIDNLLFTSLFI